MTAPGAHRAFIGLGGNQQGALGGPSDYIARALDRIAAGGAIDLVKCSKLYRSAPWGNTDQDDFINAVAEVSTALDARALLGFLLDVEGRLGRHRAERWGPRLIDLDLLSFDDSVCQEEGLSLPHPRMHERAFVLIPLLEIDPEFVIPGKGRADRFLEAIGESQVVIPE